MKKSIVLLSISLVAIASSALALTVTHPEKRGSFRSSLKGRNREGVIHRISEHYAAEERGALDRLVRNHLASPDRETKLLVRSFLNLRSLSEKGESFSIQPSDIEHAIQTWQPGSVKKFAQTLAFAADYMWRGRKYGKPVTNEEALAAAKKVYGIKDEQYGCKV